MLLLVLDIAVVLHLGPFPHVPGGSRSRALVQDVALVGGRAAPLDHPVQAYTPAYGYMHQSASHPGNATSMFLSSQ